MWHIDCIKRTQREVTGPSRPANREHRASVSESIDHYLEMYSWHDCNVYNGQGAQVAEVAPIGELPTLRTGVNEIRFTCKGPEKASARANVTIVSYGEELLP